MLLRNWGDNIPSNDASPKYFFSPINRLFEVTFWQGGELKETKKVQMDPRNSL